ncbi:hypothetical protein DFJ43DRAFT_1158010 [Lentinula guzmanii]|uniref:UBL3-like ubiquitin domain-containing protein n=1 Tax=Lentinula guzmanii TaxID=2804957 RepID=A0AA38JAY2_9AGAR|nr:hypothetical protein DFJ43DRAFT_1158010 [Lentinula guzmanii]
MAGTFPQNIPRPFTSPGRTHTSSLSPAARFHGYSTNQDNEDEVGLTTTSNSAFPRGLEQPPAGSQGISRTTATEASSSTPSADLGLPRNFTVSALAPQLQSSPYIQYLYGTLDRGQGYSTTNSARTSYTRVDSTAMGDNPTLEAENGSQDVDREAAIISGAGDVPVEEQIQAIPQTPIVSVCFLMISGRRRVMTFEPETTVGRVKELVWNTWPSGPGRSSSHSHTTKNSSNLNSDWQEERPSTPSHLRILHLGKILQDEETLTACNFPIHTSSASSSPTIALPPPTIVHLAIRPAGPGFTDFGDHGDLEKKKSRGPRTRLVARFSSVLASADSANEATSSPVQGTSVSAGTSSVSQQQSSADDSHGCTCCIVC